jgi:hypothetical protein
VKIPNIRYPDGKPAQEKPYLNAEGTIVGMEPNPWDGDAQKWCGPVVEESAGEGGEG